MKIENAMNYPNARIIYDSRVWEIGSMNFQTGMLSLFYEKIYDVTEPKDYKRFFKDVEVLNCKLQLRTLESLTGEEKDYINKNYLNYMSFDCFTDDFPNFTFQNLLENIWHIHKLAFIDWCRENNIDIDGLIESGEAELWTK